MFFTFHDMDSSYGKALLWIYFSIPTAIICGVLLIATVFLGIASKELFKIFTLINIIIICLAGTSPLWIT